MRLKDKIKKVQKYRDEQEEQLKLDTNGMSSFERVQNAMQITHIEGIIKGLDIALNQLNSPNTPKK